MKCNLLSSPLLSIFLSSQFSSLLFIPFLFFSALFSSLFFTSLPLRSSLTHLSENHSFLCPSLASRLLTSTSGDVMILKSILELITLFTHNKVKLLYRKKGSDRNEGRKEGSKKRKGMKSREKNREENRLERRIDRRGEEVALHDGVE